MGNPSLRLSEVLGPGVLHLFYVHQSCSVEGNDLNHLVEGNQAGLFECITRHYPLPSSHTKNFYIPNIKTLALVVSDKKVFSCFP